MLTNRPRLMKGEFTKNWMSCCSHPSARGYIISEVDPIKAEEWERERQRERRKSNCVHTQKVAPGAAREILVSASLKRKVPWNYHDIKDSAGSHLLSHLRDRTHPPRRMSSKIVRINFLNFHFYWLWLCEHEIWWKHRNQMLIAISPHIDEINSSLAYE